MNSKKAFKIEFHSSKEARKFLNTNDTTIGNIRLHQDSKEPEVDPTVPQCWDCGRLNPQHNSGNCPGPKKCLKCNSSEHQFFNCRIPKDIAHMTEEHKSNRHCIPCGQYGDHTSLDHRSCPEKIKVVQQKIKAARNERNKEENDNKRDSELIKNTLEISNTNAWPVLQENKGQHLMT